MSETPPVRLCCMHRHHGTVCPDGKVMCCLCFDRFDIAGLNERDGEPEDVCRPCAEHETSRMNGDSSRCHGVDDA